MEDKKRNEAYNKYVKAKIPKTKAWPSLFNSFWVGGLICVIGQGINDLLMLAFPTISQQTAWAYTLIVLIFFSIILDGNWCLRPNRKIRWWWLDCSDYWVFEFYFKSFD